MDTEALGVLACLYKDVVACCDEVFVPCLYEGVVQFLYKNNKNAFYVYSLLAQSSGSIYEGTLYGQCIVHHDFMNKFGWFETYFHFFRDHNYKTQ